eukprot:COSAG06_NODE_264_length_18850_cov_2499.951848_7_plen_132_part_00
MYLAVAEHCTELLAAADAHDKALSFAIIVGATEAAQKGAGWEALRSSWCRQLFPSEEERSFAYQDRLGTNRTKLKTESFCPQLLARGDGDRCEGAPVLQRLTAHPNTSRHRATFSVRVRDWCLLLGQRGRG